MKQEHSSVDLYKRLCSKLSEGYLDQETLGEN